MPDLTLKTIAVCHTAVDWEKFVEGSKGNTYLVRYGRTPGGQHQYGWTCTCPAFQFRGRKTCKHIERIKPARCGWNSDLNDHIAPDKCPECQGDVEYIQIGV